MFFLSRPSAAVIARFLAGAETTSLSYSPIGIARQRHVPGFDVDETTAVVGHGEPDFARALAALASWKHMKLGWVEVFPHDPSIEAGTTVAVLARHLGIWSLNACRVVYSVEESTGLSPGFGFAYGTLRDHVERGEEIFTVRFDRQTEDVVYTVRAVSRPRALIAKIGRPAARALQTRFREQTCDALRRVLLPR